jgi:hypothetical protein
VRLINGAANGEISASTTVGLLALTWSAFALSGLSSFVWLGAGLASAAYDDDDDDDDDIYLRPAGRGRNPRS